MSAVHLLVLIHGMWGNPDHLNEMARIIQQVHNRERLTGDTSEPIKNDLHVLIAQTNSHGLEYDGVDYGGERVAEEVLREVEQLSDQGRSVTRISICGYSLGGLIARYLVGILHQRKFFTTVTPINFYAFATPHAGIPRYPSLLGKFLFYIAHRLARTGQQFCLKDKWGTTGKPLLTVMADHERVFYKGLCQFPNITFYANAIHDPIVPYLTAAIELEDPYLLYPANGAQVTLHEKYSPLLVDYAIPAELPQKPTLFSPNWFRTLKSPIPSLPVGFPLNIVLILFSPIILPILVGIRLAVLRSASRSSYERVKCLESDTSLRHQLVHVLAELEKTIEDKIVNVIETEGSASTSKSADVKARGNSQTVPEVSVAKQILTKPQKDIVISLNKLPNLKKELAFIDTLPSAHAALVCRDVGKYEFSDAGKGILQHWADNFIF